jgi:hypothetical protein
MFLAAGLGLIAGLATVAEADGEALAADEEELLPQAATTIGRATTSAATQMTLSLFMRDPSLTCPVPLR